MEQGNHEKEYSNSIANLKFWHANKSNFWGPYFCGDQGNNYGSITFHQEITEPRESHQDQTFPQH